MGRPASVVSAPVRDRTWRRPDATAGDRWADGWVYPLRLFLPVRKARR